LTQIAEVHRPVDADSAHGSEHPAPALSDTVPDTVIGSEVTAATASHEADIRRSERARRTIDDRLERDGWKNYAD
jgi:hypothetical protein